MSKESEQVAGYVPSAEAVEAGETLERYVDLGSPELNALRDARRAAGNADSTHLNRWLQLDQAVRTYLVSVRK